MVDLPRSALKNKKRIKFQQMSVTTTNKLIIASWRKQQCKQLGLQVKEVKKAANSSGLSKALKQSLYLSQFGLAYPQATQLRLY